MSAVLICFLEQEKIDVIENRLTPFPLTDLQLKRQIFGVEGLPLSYYFVSFSSEESLKVARDFEADSCVTIRDYSTFFGLLEKELVRHCPEADISLRSVTYYDPLAGDPSPETPYDILSHKPIGYYYQHEVRIIVTGFNSLNDRLNLQIAPPEGLFRLRKFAGKADWTRRTRGKQIALAKGQSLLSAS